MLDRNIDMLDEITRRFLDNGKTIKASESQIEHWYCESQNFPDSIWIRSMDDAFRGSDFFPKCATVKRLANKAMPKTSYLGGDCFDCGGDGLIFGVVAMTAEGSVRINSYQEAANLEEVYYFTDAVIGRCDCNCGLEYAEAAHPGISTTAGPPAFLKESARTKRIHMPLEAKMVAVALSQKLRERSND